MPEIHPDPILSPSVVKNALFDSYLRFPIFYFPKFHLFRPCLVRFELKTYPLKLKPKPCAFCGGFEIATT